MRNINLISKAKRLNEEEVHAAAEELLAAGEHVSSLAIYKFLGRGSLTTITNFLKTWNQIEQAAPTLPKLIELPEALKKATEQLILKVWLESQAIAEKELNGQREALRQTENLTREKIAEAEAFSEEQAKQIENLESQIEKLKDDKAEEIDYLKSTIEKLREEKEKDHAFFLQEEEKLKKALGQAEKKEAIYEIDASIKGKQLLEATDKIIDLEKKLKETHDKSNTVRIENEVQRNQINQLIIDLKDQKELTAQKETDNKELREKAAKLDGELSVWKSIRPEPETDQQKNQRKTIPTNRMDRR